GTSMGPFLILAVILAIIIPMFNRGLGSPFKPKLIFIAVDGVDSAALEELTRSDDPDSFPNIKRLKDQGISGRLGASEPLIPSRLWGDIMTGRDAQAHGILDRNSAPEDLQVQTLWEILGLNGYRVGLFRMMPPHEPFEPASFDILPPDSPDPLNNPYAVLIRTAKESGVPGIFPNPLEMASFTFRLARMGV
ncbi:MAG: hypothetical protein ABIC40_02270, partial [bacterium]